MNKQTDLAQVKEICKILLMSVPIEPKIAGICCHPFTDFVAVPNIYNHSSIWNLTQEDDFEQWKDFIYKKIDEKNDVMSIFIMINKPYKLIALKYCKDALSSYDFSKLLKHCWTISENPNSDINISCSELIRFFKHADKKILMNDTEYDIWNNLPNEIVLYRGISSKSNPSGLSWTTNLETAEWFKNRWGNSKNYILKANVKKADCLCYFDNRNEAEIIVNTRHITPQKI